MKLTNEQHQLVTTNAGLIAAVLKRQMRISQSDSRYDDFFQEGFVALARCAMKYNESLGFRFSTYATRSIMRHLWRKQHKEAMRGITGVGERKQASFGVVSINGGTDSMEIEFDRETLDAKDVDLPTSQLSIRQREVFELCCRGMSYQEIAERLGITEHCVSVTKADAIKKLRRLIGVKAGG